MKQPLAYIHPDAKIAPSVVIEPFVTIDKNVVIGEGAVVGACSLVHHDLKPWGVYAGNPLVQIGTREKEPILEKATQLLLLGAAYDLPMV